MPSSRNIIDKNISPVGWYVGSYLIRFIELEDSEKFESERRFPAWENTVVVQAKSLEDAYDKIEEIGKNETGVYKGGPEGVPVQWVYEGITELLPIYEGLADGAEIMWREHKPKKLKNLQKMVGNKVDFINN